MELQNIKKQKYDELINQLDEFFAYYEKESNLNKIAKMSSLSSALKLKFNTLKFVGFYTVEKKLIKNSQNETNKDSLDISQLEIGPNSSDILATAVIQLGKGVCGESWDTKSTIIVNDVNNCKNYIACDDETQSEIVVPVFDESNSVIAVFDIDSTVKSNFDEVDKKYLEMMVKKYIN